MLCICIRESRAYMSVYRENVHSVCVKERQRQRETEYWTVITLLLNSNLPSPCQAHTAEYSSIDRGLHTIVKKKRGRTKWFQYIPPPSPRVKMAENANAETENIWKERIGRLHAVQRFVFRTPSIKKATDKVYPFTYYFLCWVKGRGEGAGKPAG